MQNLICAAEKRPSNFLFSRHLCEWLAILYQTVSPRFFQFVAKTGIGCSEFAD